MIMLVLAGLNVLIFNATIGRKVAQWDLNPKHAGRGKSGSRRVNRALGSDHRRRTRHCVRVAATMSNVMIDARRAGPHG